MECLYRIIGQQIVGTKMKLTIIPSEVEEKTTASGIMKDIGGFIGDLKAQATQSKNPDSISIPYERWKESNLDIGETLVIEITGV